MSDTGLLAIGDIAAGVAAVSALVSVGVSARAGKSARETVEIAREARREEEQFHKAAERDRLRHRYEVVGSLIEEVWRAGERRVPGFDAMEFVQFRNTLAVAIIGLESELPLCAEVVQSNSTEDAMARAGRARPEIQNALRLLLGEDDGDKAAD